MRSIRRRLSAAGEMFEDITGDENAPTDAPNAQLFPGD
jgi:hypothetical protein